MSQHDYDLANQAGSAFRSDLNSALAAIVSANSGATEPATMVAYQWWADTTTGILKQRNAANNAWISILTLATGMPTLAAAKGANADITALTSAGGIDIIGTNTNDAAAAGYVGEYIESVLSGFPVNAGGSSVYTDLTSIALTAGDWNVSGSVAMAVSTATISGAEVGLICTASGNNATGSVSHKSSLEFYNTSTITNSGVVFPSYRVSLSGAQTLYLKGYATYSAGTPALGGFISARRIR